MTSHDGRKGSEHDPVRVVARWCSSLAELRRSTRWVLDPTDDEPIWQLILDAWLLLDPAARVMLLEVLQGPPLTHRTPSTGIAVLRDLDWTSPISVFDEARDALVAIGLIFESSWPWLQVWGTEDEPIDAQLTREPEAEQRFLGALFEDGLSLTDTLGSLFAEEYLLVTFDRTPQSGSTLSEPLKFFVARRGSQWYVSLWPEQLVRWLGTPADGGGLAGVREPRRPHPPPNSTGVHLEP